MQKLPLEVLESMPFIKEVVRMVMDELDQEHGRTLIDGKLAVDEKQAAALLSLNPWQLRDLRRKGHIDHHRIVGGRVRYEITQLRDYLARGHEPPAPKRRGKSA